MLKMDEYEVYWLMDFLLIISCACLERITICFEAACTSYKKVNKQVAGIGDYPCFLTFYNYDP